MTEFQWFGLLKVNEAKVKNFKPIRVELIEPVEKEAAQMCMKCWEVAFVWKSINLDHSPFGFAPALHFRICFFTLMCDRCNDTTEKSKKCILCSAAAIIQDSVSSVIQMAPLCGFAKNQWSTDECESEVLAAPFWKRCTAQLNTWSFCHASVQCPVWTELTSGSHEKCKKRERCQNAEKEEAKGRLLVLS